MRKDRTRFANIVADFETTTNPDDCRVWAWAVANLEQPDSVYVDHTIDQFIDYISGFNSRCYFHNLKFDGHFILDKIVRMGYEHIEVSDNKEPLLPGSFKTLISDMGKWYSMTVHWLDGTTTEFRDSLKKLPMSAERVAQSFKLEESKGSIDYKAERPVGHQITDEERDYIVTDVKIIAKAMTDVLSAGMTGLTVASDSLREFKKLTGDKMFTRLFPVLKESMDDEIRRAYRGGFTYADPRFTMRRNGAGLVLDVNSLYPHVMNKKLLPHSEPAWSEFYQEDTRPLSIFSVTFTAKLKPDHIPCIQIKKSSMFSPTEYLTEINEPTTLMVTNVDWALYNDHYDIEVIEYGGCWSFHGAVGMFDNYIDKWAKIKETTTGGQREIAKLHLNSLYGKFATNPNVTSKNPEYDEEQDIVKLVRGRDDKRPPVYTAVGVFITAYARDITIRAAQANYDSFAYADTDSLHLLTTTMPDLDIDKNKMGAWKHEYDFVESLYIRPKAYLEKHADGTYTNRIAGLPERLSAELTFDDIRPGRVFHGKLAPKIVPGGVVLVDTPYEIKM